MKRSVRLSDQTNELTLKLEKRPEAAKAKPGSSAGKRTPEAAPGKAQAPAAEDEGMKSNPF
jgi:hypothetical protein